ncbi:MAG: aldose 1-epimerase family protein [Microbacteriaceae bacterium]
MRAPTGTQFTISRSSGGSVFSATITEVAASLREFTVDGMDLTENYPVEKTPPFGSGIVLAPWPNRVEDGRWKLDGVVQQLDITEPDRHNALHGLLRYSPYTLVEQTDASVTLAATIFPQHGYGFLVDTTVRYELVDGGLTVTHTAHNAGESAAPVAFGAHPFLTIGNVPTGELTVTIDAASRILVDDRLNPTGEVSVEGTDYDLRDGRVLGDRFFDDAFGQVTIVDGVSRHYLTAPDGRTLELWQDAHCGYVQVFTTQIFPKRNGVGTAVAIEPMTAPPNAFNSGDGLRWLEPGADWSVSWGLQYSGSL